MRGKQGEVEGAEGAEGVGGAEGAGGAEEEIYYCFNTYPLFPIPYSLFPIPYSLLILNNSVKFD